MSKLALWVSVAAIAAGCAKADSKLDQVNAEGNKPAVAPVSKLADKGGPVEDRLARIERRLDKVAAVLDQALGPAQPDPNTVYSVPVSPSDPVEGPNDAKVTIVEAFEFLCPYCFIVNPMVDTVLQKYPNDVRVVSKYIVIHGAPAIAAAQIGCAAHKQGKYPAVKGALWSALFKLENGQPSMQRENANVDAMKKAIANTGVDMAKLEADMPGCQDWLSTSQRTLSAIGVNSTPTFFVNGRYVQARSADALEAVIKEEIAKAEKVIADGTPAGEYYAREIVAKGEKRAKGRFDD